MHASALTQRASQITMSTDINVRKMQSYSSMVPKKSTECAYQTTKDFTSDKIFKKKSVSTLMTDSLTFPAKKTSLNIEDIETCKKSKKTKPSHSLSLLPRVIEAGDKGKIKKSKKTKLSPSHSHSLLLKLPKAETKGRNKKG